MELDIESFAPKKVIIYCAFFADIFFLFGFDLQDVKWKSDRLSMGLRSIGLVEVYGDGITSLVGEGDIVEGVEVKKDGEVGFEAHDIFK